MAGSRSAPSSPTSTRTCAERSDASSGSRTKTDDAAQDAIRADFAAAFANRTRDEWVAHLGPADTCVSEVASVPELVRDSHFRARHVLVEATAAARGTFEQRMGVRGYGPRAPGPVVRDATVTDTDALLQEVGYSAAEIAALRGRGSCRVSDLPPEVES